MPVLNIRRIQCAESDFSKWRVLRLPSLPLLLLPDHHLHGTYQGRNTGDYFIAHKFSSIHFLTSLSLTLTKRAIILTSIPSSAIERAVSFFSLSSPFSMPRFSPFSQLFTVSGCHISETDFVMFYFHFDFLTILLTWKTPSTALFLHNHQSLP